MVKAKHGLTLMIAGVVLVGLAAIAVGATDWFDLGGNPGTTTRFYDSVRCGGSMDVHGDLRIRGDLLVGGRMRVEGTMTHYSAYVIETYKLIESMMNDYENIRDFRIEGYGKSCIVTLVDADFKTIEKQGPRPTWDKLVHEVIEEWQGGR